MSNTRTVTTAAALGACVALAGCSGAPVDERPVVRIVEAAQPSQATPLGQFLPSTEELAATLGTGPDGFAGQLVEGDAEMLLRNVTGAEATPPDCVGTAYRLQEIVYGASPVQSVTSSSWAGGDFSGPPVSASFGVVQMASAADAEEFFAATTGDWRRCNGQTVVVQHPGTVDQVSRISDVGFDRRVVSANVLHASGASASPPAMRALGLVNDC
ncbi:MAG TPA: sensor domain-containing protein, partial [Mycobacterium sp.]